MNHIPLDKVKKNNSNIFAYDQNLCRVLRKERFKKPKHDVYLNYCIAANKMSFNPYADADMTMDLQKFSESLHGLELVVFQYFLEGLIQADIAIMVGKTQGRISQILLSVVNKFGVFYKDSDND